MTIPQVSIPQSGFGAFEPAEGPAWGVAPQPEFQSLSRDSGRLNSEPASTSAYLSLLFQSLSRDSGRLNARRLGGHADAAAGFNPSVGIRGV